MGEAARRKSKDPFYGRLPKAGKGIVVSNPVKIDEEGTLSGSIQIDPTELRRAVLFWDRINKPINMFRFGSLSGEEEFLKECGILQELTIEADIGAGGRAGLIYAQLHLSAFEYLEAKEPGLWALSEGENSFDFQNYGPFKQGRGALVELHRAIPLPTADVPLNELLEFKVKRRDELLSLTLELDGLFSRIVNAEDTQFELIRAISEIDRRCSDVIAAGKESRIRFSLSDFTYGVSLDVNSTNLLASGVLGSIIGSTFGLPVVGGAIGAATSTIKFNAGWGGKLRRSEKSTALALSPYRVVSRMLNEPI